MQKKYTDIEKENMYGDECVSEGEITEPFDPKDVDIVTQSMVVSNIIARLRDGGIVLDPVFQRRPDLWDDKKQSRLIESLIVRIPLPSFYFNYDNDDNYTVVDGLQRLWAIKRFAALDENDPNRLVLTDLEYLTEYNGKKFEELPLAFQRRIKEQQIVAYVIRPGTPEFVQNSIFTRINTGGLQLTPAEIKNSIYRGQAANLLKELAHSDAFIRATNNTVDPSRMFDCELVNRFLAFYLLDMDSYRGNLESFLNAVLLRLKYAQAEEVEKCRNAFIKSMETSVVLFGNRAFQKPSNRKKGNKPIWRFNKPLFESVSVCLARITDEECEKLKKNKELFIAKYIQLFEDDEFQNAISNATAKRPSIEKRYGEISRIIKETIML